MFVNGSITFRGNYLSLLDVELPDLANKNTEHEINLNFRSFKFNWASCILSDNTNWTYKRNKNFFFRFINYLFILFIFVCVRC